MGNIGKGAIAFEDLRDLRALNLAIAESKMESGITYNEQYANGKYSNKKLGRELTFAELSKANDNAAQAAFRTLQWNAPAIFLTNQIVLKITSRIWWQLGRIFDESLTNLVEEL